MITRKKAKIIYFLLVNKFNVNLCGNRNIDIWSRFIFATCSCFLSLLFLPLFSCSSFLGFLNYGLCNNSVIKSPSPISKFRNFYSLHYKHTHTHTHTHIHTHTHTHQGEREACIIIILYLNCTRENKFALIIICLKTPKKFSSHCMKSEKLYVGYVCLCVRLRVCVCVCG